jgi:hypothetical protein
MKMKLIQHAKSVSYLERAFYGTAKNSEYALKRVLNCRVETFG